MTNPIPAIVKENEVTLFIDGATRVFNDGHMNYTKIREALAAEDYDRVLSLVDIAASINAFGGGQVVVEDGVVMYNGRALHNVMTSRIIMMQREGFSIASMVAFLGNLMANSSYRAVNELYGFLEETDLPITEDGCFIAYKQVRGDYTSIHASPDGTHMDNSIGTVPEMERNEVDDDKDETCSRGLHFCSQNYLGQYGGGPGGHTMILKVNPADVVSIPTDYDNAKGRACKYEVIGEFEEHPSKDHSFDTTVYTDSFGGDMQGDDYEMITVLDAAGRLGLTVDNIIECIDDGDIDANEDSSMIRWYTNKPSGGYLDVGEDELMSLWDAAEELCGGAVNPMPALRKRIARGSVQTRMEGGVEMVVRPRK